MKRIFIYLFLLSFSLSMTGQSNTRNIESGNIMFRQLPNVLSNQNINCLYRDSRGFIWIGTSYGLNRYDAYSCQHYYDYNVGLLDNDIRELFEDSQGNIWIRTRSGYSIYDFQTGTFQNNYIEKLKEYDIECSFILEAGCDKARRYFYAYDNQKLYIHDTNNHITKIFPLKSRQLEGVFADHNKIYGTFSNGSLYYLEISSSKSYEIPIPAQWKEELKNKNSDVYVDKHGGIWIYTFQNSLLLHKRNKHTAWREVKLSGKDEAFNRIRSIEQDQEGYLWIICSHKGAYRYNLITEEMENMTHRRLQLHSLASNNLNALHIDHEGIVWIGNFKHGVNYYVPGSQIFLNYQFEEYNDIMNFIETDDDVYQGTDGGGWLKINKNTKVRTQMEIPANVIVTMKKDSQGTLWMGCFQKGLIGWKNGQITHLHTGNSNLKDNDIYGIVECNNGYLWLASLNGYIYTLNLKTKELKHHDMDRHVNFFDMIQVEEHTLYAASSNGLLRINTDNISFEWIDEGTFGENGPQDTEIKALYYDSRGWLWMGHANGLTAWDLTTNKIIGIKYQDGLPINKVKAICEDDNNQIWVGTCNGIARINFSQEKPSVISYDTNDGLMCADVNERGMYKRPNGNIMVGTPEGCIEIIPQEVVDKEYKAQVWLTKIEEQRTDGLKGLRTTSAECTEHLEFGPEVKFFGLHFATLDFVNRGKTNYAYCTDSKGENWITMPDNRLDVSLFSPGFHTLTVKASNGGNNWSTNTKVLKLHIIPHWWKSNTAMFIYVCLALLFIATIGYFLYKSQKRKLLIKSIAEENKQSQQMNEMKLQFYANISHELRTPLSLIIGPLEEFCNEHPQHAKGILQIARNNAGYLLEQINQLLDFRKLDAAAESLRWKHDNVLVVLTSIFHSFDLLAQKRNIDYQLDMPQDSIFMDFDFDKVRKIVNNLLNNAFKFTPNKGAIQMSVEVHDNKLCICVKDTGCGIPDDAKEKIFQRFYQDKNRPQGKEGNGIGLHIVSRYVQMHKGSIIVEDNQPCGAIFRILLPMHQENPDEHIATQENNTMQKEKEDGPYSILLVDDNPDFIHFLSDALKQRYRILTASDGKKALKLVENEDIDLIISDVMMPVMDGLQLCSALKNDIRYSHIPLILLTAKNSEEHQQEGLAIGADDYITKPFSLEILKLRIEKQIDRKQKRQEIFDQDLDIEPSKITITPLDQQFISNAISIVESNLENSNFSVDELSIHLNISRGYLYKKMLKITGKKPIEFIRIIRLKRAQQLLAESQMQVSEIAYILGYNSPKLFAKHFKEEFHITPSEYIKSIKK